GQVFVVEEGMTLRKVACELEDKGIIKNRPFFLLWARLKGYGERIKSGEYSLSPAMAPVKIFDILTRGLIITHPVTFPEGYSAGQIAETLAQKIDVDKTGFLSLISDPEIMRRHGVTGKDLEGYLYPDTYNFSMGQSPESIIDVMKGRFNELVSPLMGRIEESGMTLEEVVTLASIVEKETGRAEERPLIASVFLNRLKKGMRLESDPTVIYGTEEFNGNLTRDDLRRYTPYNTYVIRGLPPGPICNPGIESIRAVIFPADTEYLYFVSKNDGSHYFSKTLEEHNRNVMIYQKRKANN
ncbi:MAG: endolytic transglycosylase MltG, partial [Deltaproteobacteria bacterium]|nr:endolytic transglycosylase MltG [Deltaproteobacteria bacterium]